jgi:hypothetical protein
MYAYAAQFLLALIITVAVETAVLFLFVRDIFKLSEKKLSNRLLIFFGFLASFATIPYLWFVVPSIFYNQLSSALGIYIVLAAEVMISIFEASIYYFGLNLGAKRSLIVSFACNAFSFLIGRIIQALLI